MPDYAGCPVASNQSIFLCLFHQLPLISATNFFFWTGQGHCGTCQNKHRKLKIIVLSFTRFLDDNAASDDTPLNLAGDTHVVDATSAGYTKSVLPASGTLNLALDRTSWQAVAKASRLYDTQ